MAGTSLASGGGPSRWARLGFQILEVGEVRPAAPPEPDGRHRAGPRSRALPAIGAVAAQFSQAGASFVIQVLVARQLGAAGLGVFAVAYGLIVAATAASSGIVGDSLTVLDRDSPSLRSALQWLAVLVPVVTGLALGIGGWATHFLTGKQALLLGAAACAFLLEDISRRWLMAVLAFWRVVLVDVVALAVALAVLVVSRHAGPVTLGDFLGAIFVGQLAGAVAGIALLPAHQRYLVRRAYADFRSVFAFGGLRAVQLVLRPSMLSLVRIIIIVIVGQALFGQLEAARVYASPVLLFIQGTGSYLMSTFAMRRRDSVRQLLRRTDEIAGAMVVVAALAAVGMVVLAPLMTPIITGSAYHIDSAAIISWSMYSATVALVAPYATLGAVRGRQSEVLTVRFVESVVCVVLVAGLMTTRPELISWAPAAIAAGSLAGGLWLRQVVMRGMVRAEDRSH